MSEPPRRVRCDFDGCVFSPQGWNGRTCPACAALGAPDQSTLPWEEYESVLRAYLRSRQRRKRLCGRAARLAAQNRFQQAESAPQRPNGCRHDSMAIPAP
jgi:hypothetical protein